LPSKVSYIWPLTRTGLARPETEPRSWPEIIHTVAGNCTETLVLQDWDFLRPARQCPLPLASGCHVDPVKPSPTVVYVPQPAHDRTIPGFISGQLGQNSAISWNNPRLEHGCPVSTRPAAPPLWHRETKGIRNFASDFHAGTAHRMRSGDDAGRARGRTFSDRPCGFARAPRRRDSWVSRRNTSAVLLAVCRHSLHRFRGKILASAPTRRNASLIGEARRS